MKTKQEIKDCIIELENRDDYEKYYDVIQYLKWAIDYDRSKFDMSRYRLGLSLIKVITEENYYLDTYSFDTRSTQNWATFRLSGEYNPVKDYAIVWNTDLSNLKVIKGEEEQEQVRITKKQEKRIFNIIKRMLILFEKRKQLKC